MTDRANEDNARSRALASIADTALEEMDCAREQERWMSALFQAIRADLEKGGGQVAKELASLGQHLSGSYRSVLDEHVKNADQRMGSLGLRS